jgi:CRP-like cAMP-binding protein
LNEALESQHYIEGIIDGSLTINSAQECEVLLKKFPGDCFLTKAFADFLTGRESFAQAAQYYRKAADLFARRGVILHAVAAKVMEWHAAEPSRKECRDLYKAFRQVRSETALTDFFCHMPYPELLAVLTHLEPLRLPPGTVIKNSGDVEESLYFIVSGTVSETSLMITDEGEESRREFSANSAGINYFGDVYPFGEQKQFPSVIETVNSTELLTISKSQLIDLCEEYPKVEILLMILNKAQRLLTEKRVSHRDRKSARYQLHAQVDMKIINNEPNKSHLILKGFIQDISLGGACLTLGEKYLTGSPAEIIGKSIKVLVNIPKVEFGLNLCGTIVWTREIFREGKTMIIAGIQFKDMTHSDLTFLKKHCYVGEDAQDLISYLWESLPKS